MIIKIIRIILIGIIMRRRTTQPICWERRKLVVYNVENIYYNTCNWFISIKFTWRIKMFWRMVKIYHFIRFYLICLVQKLLIRSLPWSLHLKVSDWGRKGFPDSATDWNKWSIAKRHHNTKIPYYGTRKQS